MNGCAARPSVMHFPAFQHLEVLMATILGTQDDDNGVANPALVGTAEADAIAGFAGDDLLEGLGGDDFLSPGAGTDTVRGGDGDDRVLLISEPRGQRDVLDGGAGFDRLILEPRDWPVFFSLADAPFTGFERIDLNDNVLTLNAFKLDGITQITGFGARGELRVQNLDSVNLGGIVVGEANTGVGRLTNVTVGNVLIDATGAAAAWHLTSGGGGDTLRGGAGDDVFTHERFEGQQRSEIDGGPGRDTLRSPNPGRVDLDYSGVALTSVEVFEGSGKLTAGQIAAFEEFRGVGTLEVVTPGTIDLTGRIASTAFTRPDTGAAIFTVLGPVGPFTFTMTDARAQLTLLTGPGRDTITTGAGNETIRDWWTADWSTGDLIRAGDGNDVVRMGLGNDTIIAWGSADDGNDVVEGGAGSDSIEGGAGNDRLYGASPFDTTMNDGSDTVDGGLGADLVMGGGGDDLLIGGPDEGDLADVIYGHEGNDTIRGGGGNDSLLGGNGDDLVEGGAGADTLIGHGGDDTLSGGALADLIFGGLGDDFINGGFRSDRLNGGAGADRFFHAGVAGHGSDWIQDFAVEDALVAWDAARASDFQVNRANTPGAGAAGVDEAFVIYKPTGQILWALVDGAALDSITLRIQEVNHDLLA
jgi:Ca2+-binding RTX toxin-like protein